MDRRTFSKTLLGAAAFTPFIQRGSAMADNSDWFPKEQMMTIGVYYYPEAWPESQWARDMENMKKLGMEFVHMAEFAWYFMEPEEGQYQFDWLERNVELAANNGLKVILCTPSATPP
ncbi:MAG: beta-galactosidase, partial [Acidobacteriaceae bacterium]|nr:beta-galactosidase [Acidobacteriaceae bacterium]